MFMEEKFFSCPMANIGRNFIFSKFNSFALFEWSGRVFEGFGVNFASFPLKNPNNFFLWYYKSILKYWVFTDAVTLGSGTLTVGSGMVTFFGKNLLRNFWIKPLYEILMIFIYALNSQIFDKILWYTFQSNDI